MTNSGTNMLSLHARMKMFIIYELAFRALKLENSNSTKISRKAGHMYEHMEM